MGPKTTDIEKKIKKRARQKRYTEKNVHLGDQMERWKMIKSAIGAEKDSVVAQLLIESYLEVHAIEPKITLGADKWRNQSPEETCWSEEGDRHLSDLGDSDIDSHCNSSDGEQTSAQKVPKIDVIQGLPLNIPFTLDIKNPKSHSSCKSKPYILIEHSSLCQSEPVYPVHLGLSKNNEQVTGSLSRDSEITVPSMTNDDIGNPVVIERLIKVEESTTDSCSSGFNVNIGNVHRPDRGDNGSQTPDQGSRSFVVIKTEPYKDGE